MELEKLFVKNYKRVCVQPSEDQINYRLEGINIAKETYGSVEKMADLIKIYYKLAITKEKKDEFIEFFYSIDKMFDEQNEEEICILAGFVLAYMLQDEEELFIAYSIKVLENFFDGPINELPNMANQTIIEHTKESGQLPQFTLDNLKSGLEKELIEEGSFSEMAPESIVDSLKIIRTNFSKIVNYSNSLQEENRKCREKIQVLSWIVGEWSDLLKKPLSEVKDIDGTLVLGVELANLVDVPGPLSAESLLHKMIVKCDKTIEEITLTDLIDNQTEDIRREIVEKYGNSLLENNLPILSALDISLTVDKKREWLPAYKKAWRINPDEIKFSISKWSNLIYFECMISKLI